MLGDGQNGHGSGCGAGIYPGLHTPGDIASMDAVTGDHNLTVIQRGMTWAASLYPAHCCAQFPIKGSDRRQNSLGRAVMSDAMQVPAPLVGRVGEYDAFLSYTHRDRPVASGIQKGLHQIGRRLGQLRALRVFRDDTNLEVSPDLWGKITESLDRPGFWWWCYLLVRLSRIG
jgi:hypothetical protein